MIEDSVFAWLLDSDPSIRWQVMRDVLRAPADEVAAERARIATGGFGAQLLALQAPDGRWGGAAWNHGWDSTMHVLTLLREMGLDPASDRARQALGRVRSTVTWRGCGPPECDANAFFDGEIEPCINGQVAAAGAYFGQDVRRIVERLLAEQLPDGGWNCEAENGSTRSSFNTTICVLEALLECELSGAGSAAITAARLRGQEYLLERRLFRRKSTGEVIERDRKRGADWTRFAYPTWWHYDVLRGLDFLRRAGVAPDERMDEAIALVASKRNRHGQWPLEVRYPGTMPIEIDDGEGRPSRWNTLRALRVLEWASSRGLGNPTGPPVLLVDYDPAWPDLFAAERAALTAALGSHLAGPIEHIGSTSVPGLLAKPILDIMVPVESLAASRAIIPLLRPLGYVYFPYQADVMHWFCKPSPEVRTHHLHAVPIDSPLWRERLAFRDLLRRRQDIAAEYAALKRQLAELHRNDREAYTDAKTGFIQRALRVLESYSR